VFASADTSHPKRLTEQGRAASPVAVFARNELCALVRPGLAVTPDSLLDTMLDPKVRVGTSTPKDDPSGDYAFALFGKAEAIKAGAKAALEAKALLLAGGPASPKARLGVPARLQVPRAECVNANIAALTPPACIYSGSAPFVAILLTFVTNSQSIFCTCCEPIPQDRKMNAPSKSC
jgi:ABC-type molybdate transport system substrate-binding protein